MSEDNYVKVQDGLVRDVSSKAILNTDKTGYHAFKAARSASRVEVEAKREIATLKHEVTELKGDLSEIKSMLAQLLTRE